MNSVCVWWNDHDSPLLTRLRFNEVVLTVHNYIPHSVTCYVSNVSSCISVSSVSLINQRTEKSRSCCNNVSCLRDHGSGALMEAHITGACHLVVYVQKPLQPDRFRLHGAGKTKPGERGGHPAIRILPLLSDHAARHGGRPRAGTGTRADTRGRAPAPGHHGHVRAKFATTATARKRLSRTGRVDSKEPGSISPRCGHTAVTPLAIPSSFSSLRHLPPSSSRLFRGTHTCILRRAPPPLRCHCCRGGGAARGVDARAAGRVRRGRPTAGGRGGSAGAAMRILLLLLSSVSADRGRGGATRVTAGPFPPRRSVPLRRRSVQGRPPPPRRPAANTPAPSAPAAPLIGDASPRSSRRPRRPGPAPPCPSTMPRSAPPPPAPARATPAAATPSLCADSPSDRGCLLREQR